MTRVLLVEGDAPLRRALGTMLRAHRFEVVEADTGEEGLRATAVHRPDAVILELALPDMDGMQVLAEIRTRSEIPVIVLSIRDQRDDKVAALDAGADDYVTKPFDTEELLARIRAALRRYPRAPAAPGIIRFGDLEIDLDRRQVRDAGTPVRLTRTELTILEVLASNPGRLVTYELLANRLDATGRETEDAVAALRVHVGNLRRKLGDPAARPRLILTEPGLGYRWLPEA